ncbi:MAG TPA: OB-fold nucleic acid binding domain-containing protein, partial [Ktedonobacterales bacterium]|nr:OB-fold nucleic acid binding domain-containing protein [Ktedonobacterales bacterium]
EALALSGALDGLPPRMERRQRLWRLREVWPFVAPATSGKRGRTAKGAAHPDRPQQLALSWGAALAPSAPRSREAPAATPPITPPPLPALDASARLALDYALLGMSPRPHPMRALRRDLRKRGVRAIAELAEIPAGQVTRVAGWVISAQRPPTAKGMGFLVLEDETGRLPVAVPPRLAAAMYPLVRGSSPLIATGRVERVRWYRSLLALDLAAIETTAQHARSG